MSELKKYKVAHIITRLTLGGAQENTVFTFLNHNPDKYDAYLIAGSDQSFGGSIYFERLKNNKKLMVVKEMVNPINPVKDMIALFKLYIFLKRNGIDIVHTHSSKAGVLGRIAARAAGVPVIVHTVHGWSFNDGMGSIKRKVYEWIEQFAAKLCDRLIAVTERDIGKGLAAGIGNRHKYITIRSGIAFEKFKSFNNEKVCNMRAELGNKKIIGTIGRISEQKNLLDFVNIAEKLINKRKDLKFVILGDGPLRAQLQEFIDRKGLKNDIELLGVRSDINDLYYVLDILLMTSLWEGLPRVIPEAMFCGVPIVANSVDGVSEIIADGINGFTTLPHDLEDACGKIERLIDDAELRESVVKSAYNTAYPEYDAQLMVRKIEKLYEDILSEKPA